MKELESLEKKIGHRFSAPDLLKEALTHRSYINENPSWPYAHNERLEYLGDAVLELAVSEDLFRKFPKFPEGQLTVLRAALVNYVMMAHVAGDIGLAKCLFMSKGESRDAGKAREVILANALEALIGALYLDAGFEVARLFIKKFIFVHIDEVLKTKSYRDPKSELQELVQEKLKVTPTYKVLSESGPAHQRIFRIGAYFGDALIAEGSGASKQEAETEAAKAALLIQKK